MANKPFYEAGRYETEIVGQGFVKANSGNTQFVLRFMVKGRIDPADSSKMFAVPAQYERSMFRALTDKTIDYFLEDIGTLGLEIGSFSELDPNNQEGFKDLRGKTVDMMCAHEAGQEGNLRERWSLARTFTSKPIESIASAEVKSLDRLFGKHLKKGPPPVARTAQEVPTNGLGITDDDVPF